MDFAFSEVHGGAKGARRGRLCNNCWLDAHPEEEKAARVPEVVE